MAKMIITGTGKWDGEVPVIQPSSMTLKAYRVLQVQSGLKSKDFHEATSTIGGQTAVTVFASLRAAGKPIDWVEAEALTMDQIDFIREPGDMSGDGEDDEEESDPTSARTVSGPGVEPDVEGIFPS